MSTPLYFCISAFVLCNACAECVLGLSGNTLFLDKFQETTGKEYR